MVQESQIRILVGAGGTGGHLFPAIAVVQALENTESIEVKASFMGTSERMESSIVPSLGYNFNPIPIKGFNKLLSLNTLMLPLRIIRSIRMCRKIIKKFKPQAVICTGAYISYPVGVAAFYAKVPLILMESNVNPGKTIKALANKAFKIITSFDDTISYFDDKDTDKVINLGNPVRKELYSLPEQKEARLKFGLDPHKKTVLVFGGSLGALSINNAVRNGIDRIKNKDIQILWQTGKNFEPPKIYPKNVKILQFIDDMAGAYASADLVVSRSGATTVAELSVCGKPSILVPLPSASNNEQELNARMLVDKDAAILVRNNVAEKDLFNLILDKIEKKDELEKMGKSALALAKPNAAKDVAKIILDLKQTKS